MASFNNSSGNGRLATDRYDFERHVNGTDDRHTDAQIDLSSAIVELPGSTTVQSALVALASRSIQETFLTIGGDDYDVYENVLFDTPLKPNLDAAFTAAFADSRLKDGGVLFIKAGTYKIGDTITVPPGITILGEGFGTKLINNTNPDMLGPEKPMFIISEDVIREEDLNINGNDAAYDPFLNSKAVRFVNFVIADNFIKSRGVGDFDFIQPQNLATPLIYVNGGAGFVCDKMLFLGRSVNGTPSLATFSAIEVNPDNLTSSVYSTSLDIRDSEFDGFNRILRFRTDKAASDYLIFKNNRCRVIGPVNNDPSAATSNVFFTTPCNIDISSNYLWMNTRLDNLIYVDELAVTPPPYQARSKVIVCNNQIATNKASASPSPGGFTYVKYVTPSDAFDRVCEFVAGNVMDPDEGYNITFEANSSNGLSLRTGNVTLNKLNMTTSQTTLSETINLVLGTGSPLFSIGSTIDYDSVSLTLGNVSLPYTLGGTSLAYDGTVTTLASTNVHINSSVRVRTSTASGSYTVLANDFIILADTTVSTTITLPVHVVGRKLIIKDISGNAGVLPITLERNGGTGRIDDFLGNRTISTNWASLTLVSDGTNWLII